MSNYEVAVEAKLEKIITLLRENRDLLKDICALLKVATSDQAGEPIDAAQD
jgi:hypothetical protein